MFKTVLLQLVIRRICNGIPVEEVDDIPVNYKSSLKYFLTSLRIGT